MIRFRQKIFFAPALVAAAKSGAKAAGAFIKKDLTTGSGMATMMGVQGIGTGATMIQSGIQNKAATAIQKEQFNIQQKANKALAKTQAEVAKKNAEAVNNRAKAVKKSPQSQGSLGAISNVATGLSQTTPTIASFSEPSQRSYATPAALAGIGKKLVSATQKGGQTIFEFGKALNNAGKGNNIVKKVGHGLAMGTTMAAGGYLVDKAVQKDREKLTGGAPLPKAQEDPKKKNKAIKKAVTSAALIGGTVLAARKGMLGKGFQNLSHGLSASGKKINSSSILKNVGKEYKSGFKEQFVKDGKINKGGTALTLGFAAMPAISYIGERKQLKDQASSQQKVYSENYQYKEESKKRPGSTLGKIALGTAATVGSVALARRVGPAKLRRGINDMYMTYGKKFAGKSGTGKLGNWMMKSGASEYGKAQAKIAQGNLKAVVKAGGANASKAESVLKNLDTTKLAEKAGQARLKAVQSGKAGRKLGEGVLSGISSMWTGANGQQTNKFLNSVACDAGNSEATRKTAEWLGKHKRTALVGSIAVGSIAFKPFEWGDKAVRAGARAVDKNAFAYEKSKEQQV